METGRTRAISEVKQELRLRERVTAEGMVGTDRETAEQRNERRTMVH